MDALLIGTVPRWWIPFAIMAAMGNLVGPPRPPTLPCSDDEIAEAREVVQELGWTI